MSVAVQRPPPISLPKLSEGLPTMQYDEIISPDQSHSFSSTSFTNNTSVRSNWDVQDSKLKSIPPLHPPIPPNCMAYIGDTSATPSIVASRISQCLLKRSIVVEYDSEGATPTATCLNQNGVLYSISLYRGGKGTISGQFRNQNRAVGKSSIDLSMDSTDSSTLSSAHSKLDFSHGIIVECLRIRGDTISFHRDCRAILASAKGESDGLHDLLSTKVALMHPLGFGCKRSRAMIPFGKLSTKYIQSMNSDALPGLVDVRKLNLMAASCLHSPIRRGTDATFHALSVALENLERDRLDAILAGLESIALLTDINSSGLEQAYLSSLTVLGSSNKKWDNVADSEEQRRMRSLSRLHERIQSFVSGNYASSSNPSTSTHLIAGSGLDDESSAIDSDQEESECIIFTDFFVKFHRIALHILTNALQTVINHSSDFPLLVKPSCEIYMTTEILNMIANDLAGANRPPMTSIGTAHEATYAAKYLHLMASYSVTGRRFLSGAIVGSPPQSIESLLGSALRAGVSCHRALELEAQVALETLTGKDYS